MTRNSLLLRLRSLFVRQPVERELDDELAFHIEMETRKNLAAGMTPEHAARAARVQFGTDPGAVKDYIRDTRRLRFFETLFHDVRYALRGFRRTPLFALTVIGTIAIGLGWNTAAFTIFNAFVLHPIDARDPYSLYAFVWQDRRGKLVPPTWNQVDDLRQQHPGLAAVTAMFYVRTRLDGHFANCALVDDRYFPMLGVGAAMGRTLLSPGGNAAASGGNADGVRDVVLSFAAWQIRFGAAPDILGRKVLIQGVPFAVVGVMPEEFTGLGHGYPDAWIPLANLPAFGVSDAFAAQAPSPVSLAGSLLPAETSAQAGAALTVWMQKWTRDRVPEQAPHATLTSLATLVPQARRTLGPFVSIGIVFLLVLLSACANVANLMLARAMSRQREIGIRLSLGAARMRLIRQLLTESILLAIPSAAMAFVVSEAFIKFGISLCYATIPPAFGEQDHLPPILPDAHVFWFMISAAIAVALMFGLVPAIQATRLNVMQAARGDFSSEFRPARLRNALVIAQVTVCGFLLICSAVFLRRANRLEGIQPGMRTSDILELDLQPRSRALDMVTLQAHPGIETLASSSDPPFDAVLPGIAASGANQAGAVQVPYRYSSPGYFLTLGIPVVRGRAFSAEDVQSEAAVVVASESVALKLWPHEDAIGQTLTLTPRAGTIRGGRPPRYRTVQVIGVVRDSAVGAIDDPARSSLFFPSRLDDPRNVLLARVHGEPQQALRDLDAALERADAGSVLDLHLLQDYVDAGIWSYRLEYWISEALGAIALLLTLSGIYAVLAYVVAQRTKEIGIRMALGAGTGVVSSLVLRQCLRLACVGISLGIGLALATARILSAFSSNAAVPVFGVVDYTGGSAVVLLACLAAAYFPARRASRVDPITTLRYD